MTVQSPPPPPPSYGAPAPPPRKGLHPLAWVGIGCGVLLLIVVIGVVATGMFAAKKIRDTAQEFQENPEMMAVEAMIRMNPELELVESDREAGTMTIRNKQTNETITVNYQDIKDGEISFETDEGTSSIDMTGGEDGGITITDANGQTSTLGGEAQVPDWIPSYPGATSQGAYSATGPDGATGGFTITTSDSPTEVLDFYESQLEGAGFKVDKTTYTTGDGSGGMISAEGENRQVGVMISTSDEGTSALVTFTDKNQ